MLRQILRHPNLIYCSGFAIQIRSRRTKRIANTNLASVNICFTSRASNKGRLVWTHQFIITFRLVKSDPKHELTKTAAPNHIFPTGDARCREGVDRACCYNFSYWSLSQRRITAQGMIRIGPCVSVGYALW